MNQELPPPEIIPPGKSDSQRGTPIADRQLADLAHVLDELFHIPGTNIRFGLDALAGLIPGLGDTITGLVSLLIVFAGWQRGLPRVTLARMVANIAIDSILGALPLVGDIFDVAWKSNRLNLELLRRAERWPSRKQTAGDWSFLVAAVMVIAALVALPLLLIAGLIRELGV